MQTTFLKRPFSKKTSLSAQECYCGNEYGSRGEADASDCDPDGDGIPDCGKGLDGVCSWRNAVYDLNGDRTPEYVGCFVDSEDDDGTATVVASGVGG